MKKYIFIIILFMFLSCVIEDGIDRSFRKVAFDTLESNKILTNDESTEILFDRSKRYFYLNELIQVRQLDNQSFQVTSYFLYTIKNVDIYAKLDIFDEYIKLIHLDYVRPLTQTTIKYPFLDIDNNSFSNYGNFYETEDGKIIEILDNLPLENIKVVFKVDSKDKNFEKTKNFKVKWKAVFGAYQESETEGWWLMNPSQAREWVALITNFASIVSSDLFKESFFQTEGLYDNAKNVFTADDMIRVYNNILNKDLFSLGVVKGYSGLGGGATLGVAQYCLLTQYYSAGDYEVIFHEFGHTLGYGHDSNMTYPAGGTGFTPLTVRVCKQIIDEKKLFYQDYRILDSLRLDKEFWLDSHNPKYYNY